MKNVFASLLVVAAAAACSTANESSDSKGLPDMGRHSPTLKLQCSEETANYEHRLWIDEANAFATVAKRDVSGAQPGEWETQENMYSAELVEMDDNAEAAYH